MSLGAPFEEAWQGFGDAHRSAMVIEAVGRHDRDELWPKSSGSLQVELSFRPHHDELPTAPMLPFVPSRTSQSAHDVYYPRVPRSLVLSALLACVVPPERCFYDRRCGSGGHPRLSVNCPGATSSTTS